MDFLTLFGVLAAGSMVFYAFWSAVLIGTMVFFMSGDHWACATGVMVLAAVGLAYAGIFNLYHFALQEPWTFVLYVVSYVALGAVWSVFKWWRFVVRCYDRYERQRTEFLRKNGATVMSEALKALWYERHYHAPVPTYQECRGAIATWMMFWPFSILSELFSDWLRQIFIVISDMLGGVYRSIVASVFKDALADAMTAEEYARYQNKLP